jgi:chorismate synthase
VQGGVIINTSEADTRRGQRWRDRHHRLMRDVQSELKTGIPVLKDIPGLGWLFRNSNKSRQARAHHFVTPKMLETASLGGDLFKDKDKKQATAPVVSRPAAKAPGRRGCLRHSPARRARACAARHLTARRKSLARGRAPAPRLGSLEARMVFRFLTAGESHGPGLTAILEGLPSGLGLDPEAVDAELRRRQGGHGRGARMQIEVDCAQFTAGVRHGKTLGSPLALHIPNRDHVHWEAIMAPFGAAPQPPLRVVTAPRPGHADLAGGSKHRARDLRDILERASARETAARRRGGDRASSAVFGVRITGHTRALGGIDVAVRVPEDAARRRAGARGQRSRRPDVDAAARMVAATPPRPLATPGRHRRGLVLGLPPGLGATCTGTAGSTGRLGQALLSIPP